MKVDKLHTEFQKGMLILFLGRYYRDFYNLTLSGDICLVGQQYDLLTESSDEVTLGRFVTLEELAAQAARIAELEAQVAPFLPPVETLKD